MSQWTSSSHIWITADGGDTGSNGDNIEEGDATDSREWGGSKDGPKPPPPSFSANPFAE